MSQQTADPELYAEIQDFYARHMHLIDAGQVDAWVETFTEDATISNNVNPHPAHGREQIVGVIRRAQQQLDADGIRHRHWMGMLVVEPTADGTVHARSYAMLLAVRLGEAPVLDRSTRCHDELVRVDGDWQIRSRRVHHDGRP
ncbi:nuclear transport factor 2 family protein [Kitasatospora phosalacinea]|uniref:Nuclear transport factor 2 family protein n=1 Tax=Kitasatospora phosalacinea TaxID=2065 RepID=A0ABW6GGW8_9ACTN